ncbi:portal protein [Methylobacterium oxalidis]|uniref:Portal protein n=1 Tax=Methylobacterium oxalidis TaxID=944322 RepID=A0A512J253_9HYPH|nr:portal protein [Methylobacterium oxalidis]GEP04040.1 hypothetical protein MOX02_20780 [Methylobacterium oxalidis]GJE34835.1 hypothetical protein LDDCCGHA_5050 [Methylobacterium oxalidis]GLS64071.1 hypothetical protein GCM10007888_24520 [Methylobacterium oxalidis]
MFDFLKPKKKAPAGRDPVIELAMKRWRRADEADRENRDAAYEDLRFVEEPGAQWTEEAKRIRGDRPCLEFDRLGTTVAQITGDIRQMRPSIKVVPVDDRGDVKTAEVNAGLVRYVENRSDAPAAYFAAADQQVTAGIGHWEVTTEYASDSTFEQEIRITGIPDGIGVRWDPDAKEPTREDAKFCFVPVDMSRDAYEEAYPDKPSAEIGDTMIPEGWSTSDAVRVAAYWTKTPVKKTLALLPDGTVYDLTDGDPEKRAKAEARGARIEQRDGFKVERYLISATEVLEGPMAWPGRFIPVVPAIGIETQIGKKRVRRGVVRKAKDAQRAYNYARSTQTEVVGLQPKAPFTGTETMFKGYEDVWETANTEYHAFLPYNVEPKAPQLRPERVAPPVPSTGLAELTRESAEDIKAVTGVYDASLGARSNETSGKAIMARQREGDVGSFVYIVNFSRAVRHTGAIVLDLIPHVYDTARTLRIVGEDGKVDLVKINQPQGLGIDGKPESVLHDVTVGAYDVAMEMGPSYTTKREAAADGMVALIQAAPDLAPLVLDLFAKAQDWPMADKIAKRIRSQLPPQIQAEEAQEAGEPPPAPPPPSPVQQAMLASQERQQQLEAGRQQLDLEKLDVEREKLRAEVIKIQGEIQEAQAEAQARVAATPMPGAGPDLRLDEIGAAVSHLSEIVMAILEEMPAAPMPDPAGQDGPPAPAQPMLGQMPAPIAEPPQGGFFVDPSALGEPAAPVMVP